MEKIDIFTKLNKNLNELNILEDEISMVELAIYQKSISEIKTCKLTEVNNFFEQQAKMYSQKSSVYQSQIQEIIEIFSSQIEKLIKVYDELYINVFKILQNARDNQKIAVANIATLESKINNLDITEEKRQELKNCQIACAQKKLNYSVIIDECIARIKWCTESIIEDINNLFTNNTYTMELSTINFWTKIRNFFLNKILGKNKFQVVLTNYKTKSLKEIKSKVDSKTTEIFLTLQGILYQMEETKKQINEYNKESV